MNQQEKLIGDEMITPEEIQLIEGYDLEGAIREHQYCVKSLGRFPNSGLPLDLYCQMNRLDLNEIIQLLNPMRTEEELIISDEFEQEQEYLEVQHMLRSLTFKKYKI